MSLRVHYLDWKDAVRAIATLWNSYFSGDHLTAKVDTTHYIIVDSTDTGIVLKSANGHYWRSEMSDVGVLTWTDLGTTKP